MVSSWLGGFGVRRSGEGCGMACWAIWTLRPIAKSTVHDGERPFKIVVPRSTGVVRESTEAAPVGRPEA